jgi:cell division septum initiation protein DivIVA
MTLSFPKAREKDVATKQQSLLDELRNLMALRDAGEITAEEVEIRTAQVLQGQSEEAAASGRPNRAVTAATSATPTPIRRPIAVEEPAAAATQAAPAAPAASAAPGTPVAPTAPAATEQTTTRWGRRRDKNRPADTGSGDADRVAAANGNNGQPSAGDNRAATPGSPTPLAQVKAAPEPAGGEKGPIGPTMATAPTPSVGGETAAKAAAEAVGVRITDILKTALEAGQEARQTMEADAAKTLEQAERKAADVVRLAEHRAEQLRIQSERVLREAEAIKATAIENARVEAARIVEESRRQSETLQNYIDGLTEFKAKAANELRRLQEQMASASATPQPTEAATAETDSVVPRPVGEVEMNGSDRSTHPGA